MATGIFGAYCQTCGYSLEGLVENRCPECGRRFDSGDSRTYDAEPGAHLRRRRRRVLGAVLLGPLTIIPVIWLSVPIPLLGSIAVIVGIIAAGFLLWKKRWLAGAAVALGSPLTVNFGLGAIDYANASGAVRFRGLPSTESHNVDRDLRCARRGGGCLVNGNEWIVDGAYNLALTTLIRIFGPMRGSYIGRYPTEAEALAALQYAERIPLSELMTDKVTIGSREVRLDPGVGPALGGHLSWVSAAHDESSLVDELSPLQAVLDRGVLILRVPQYPRGSGRERKAAAIVLIDPVSGRPFAYYAEGDYYHRFPPASWRP